MLVCAWSGPVLEEEELEDVAEEGLGATGHDCERARVSDDKKKAI
jgi:hypothetical protein